MSPRPPSPPPPAPSYAPASHLRPVVVRGTEQTVAAAFSLIMVLLQQTRARAAERNKAPPTSSTDGYLDLLLPPGLVRKLYGIDAESLGVAQEESGVQVVVAPRLLAGDEHNAVIRGPLAGCLAVVQHYLKAIQLDPESHGYRYGGTRYHYDSNHEEATRGEKQIDLWRKRAIKGMIQAAGGHGISRMQLRTHSRLVEIFLPHPVVFITPLFHDEESDVALDARVKGWMARAGEVEEVMLHDFAPRVEFGGGAAGGANAGGGAGAGGDVDIDGGGAAGGRGATEQRTGARSRSCAMPRPKGPHGALWN